MKKVLYTGILIILYFILMLAILEFDFMLMFNLKLFFFVVIGATILTLLNFIHGFDRQALKTRLKTNILITSGITAVLSMISSFAHSNLLTTVIISDAILALFYGVLLILIFDFVPETTFVRPVVTSSESLHTVNQKVDDVNCFVKKYDLTKRETAILELLLKDEGNRAIGEALFISENTVKKHTQNIYRKTNVRNRTELIQLVLTEGSRGEV